MNRFGSGNSGFTGRSLAGSQLRDLAGGSRGGIARGIGVQSGVNGALRGDALHHRPSHVSSWRGDPSLWRSGHGDRLGKGHGRPDFGHHHHHRHHPHHDGRFVGYWPFWGFGAYPFLNFSYLPYYSYRYPYGYGYDYPYVYSYDYRAPLSYGLGSSVYYSNYNDDNSLASTVLPAGDASDAEPDNTFYAKAYDTFRRGDYQGALRWAQHAAIESPQDIRVHRLMAQAMFAIGDYRGAAVEAHAALALGEPMDWGMLQGYYGDIAAYTAQLRALEKSVRGNPSAPEGRFLLGYQYLMMGYPQQARDEFAKAAKLVPDDKLAAELRDSLNEDASGKGAGEAVNVTP